MKSKCLNSGNTISSCNNGRINRPIRSCYQQGWPKEFILFHLLKGSGFLRRNVTSYLSSYFTHKVRFFNTSDVINDDGDHFWLESNCNNHFSRNEGFSSKYWSKIYLCIQGGKVDNTPVPVDGFDVWETVSFGKPSPRTEILLNIDLKSEKKDNKINSDPFYQGAAIRVGDMKLLMSCPNSTWFKPPELCNAAVINDKVSIL